MITITSDFECGNGKHIQRLSEQRFRLEVDADKQDGYCVYWCFDLINEGPETEVQVELWEDSQFGGPTAFHAFFPTTIWIRSESLSRYRPLLEDPEDCEDHIVIPLKLSPDERVRVAMTYVAPYSEVMERVRALANERSERCGSFVVGESVQGREITGLRFGTPGKPKVFCVAGQHPHEHAGVWACLGIADFMSSLIPDAEALREELDVWVVPIVNPDGNVLGRNAYTAEGGNMYVAFGDDASADEPVGHESRVLWDWVTREMPALWMNFHCYTGWRLNSEYPYDGWYEVADRGIFADPGQRRIYDAICDTMRLQTDGPSTHERAATHPEASLCHQLAARHNIPHAFHEINVATAGQHTATRRGLHVFGEVTRTLLHRVR